MGLVMSTTLVTRRTSLRISRADFENVFCNVIEVCVLQVAVIQIVCVASVNDGHVAAGESVLMDVLLLLGAYIHRDPPGCKGIEFETSAAASPPCSVDDNRHLGQQLP